MPVVGSCAPLWLLPLQSRGLRQQRATAPSPARAHRSPDWRLWGSRPVSGAASVPSGEKENNSSAVAPSSRPQDVRAPKHLFRRLLILCSVDQSRVCYPKRRPSWVAPKRQAPGVRPLPPGPANPPPGPCVLSPIRLWAEVKVQIEGVSRIMLKGL